MPVAVVGDDKKINVKDLVVKPREEKTGFNLERDIHPEDRKEMEELVTKYINSNALLPEGFKVAYQLREIFGEDKPLKNINPQVLSLFISRVSSQIDDSLTDFDISIYRASRIVSVLPEKRKEFSFPSNTEDTQKRRFEIQKGVTPWDQYFSLCESRLVWCPKLIDFTKELTLEQKRDLKEYLNPTDRASLEWRDLARAKIMFKDLIPEDMSFYLNQAEKDITVQLEYARKTVGGRDDSWEIVIDDLYYLQVLKAKDIVLTERGWHLIMPEKETPEHKELPLPERRKY